MKELKEEDFKFSEDENMLHIGNETYIAEESTHAITSKCSECNVFDICCNIAYLHWVKCLPSYRKDERLIVWKFKGITNK